MPTYPGTGQSPWGVQLKQYIDDGDARSEAAQVAAEAAAADAEAARDEAVPAADTATSAAGAASASATSAAASADTAAQAAEDAVAIVIADVDGAMATAIETPGTDTASALSASTDARVSERVPIELAADPAPAQAAANAVQTALDNGGVLHYLKSYDDTGVASGTAALQAAFDERPIVHLEPNSVILIDGAGIYLDSLAALGSDYQGQYVLDGGGTATIKFGDDLPKVPAYTPGASAFRWAFHVNNQRGGTTGTGTSRSAAHTDANRSTGSAFPSSPRLILRNLVIDGESKDVGVAFGNTAVVKFENVQARYLKRGMSWRGYGDGAAIVGGQHSQAPDDSWMIDQFTNGDGIRVDKFKGGLGGVHRAVTCNSAVITDVTQGRFDYKASHGIVVDGGHWEGDDTSPGYGYPTGVPIFKIDRSHVTIRSPFTYRAYDTSVPFIKIADSPSEGGTTLVLDHPLGVTYYGANNPVDAPRAADLHIEAINNGSVVRVQAPRGAVLPSGSAAVYPTALKVDATPAAVATALANGILATEGGELRFRNGAWEVADLATPGLRVMRPLVAPSFAVAQAAGADATGTLVAATYEYVMALLDSKGRYTTQSSVRSITLATTGAVRMIGTFQTAPARVVVWRKSGTGVQAAPDAYCVLPVAGSTFRLYDTGAHLNGTPWVTTAVPVPNTVAASNATISETVLS